MIIKNFSNVKGLGSLKKYITFLKLNILFLVSFFLIQIFHQKFFGSQTILAIILTDIFFSCILNIFLIKKYSFISNFEIFSSTISSILLALLYSFLVPVMVNRSITVNMMMMMRSAGDKGVYLKDLKHNEFQDNVFDKRFKEMSQSGIIKIKNKKAKLTRKGKIVSLIFYINKYIMKQ